MYCNKSFYEQYKEESEEHFAWHVFDSFTTNYNNSITETFSSSSETIHMIVTDLEGYLFIEEIGKNKCCKVRYE